MLTLAKHLLIFFPKFHCLIITMCISSEKAKICGVGCLEWSIENKILFNINEESNYNKYISFKQQLYLLRMTNAIHFLAYL